MINCHVKVIVALLKSGVSKLAASLLGELNPNEEEVSYLNVMIIVVRVRYLLFVTYSKYNNMKNHLFILFEIIKNKTKDS